MTATVTATQSTQRLSELAQRLPPFTNAAPAPAEAGNGLAGLGVKEDEYLKDGERNWQGSPSGASWALSAVVAAVLAAVSSTLWMCTATWTPASQ